METIIGLLVIVLPIVFRLIGKRLEQAGQVSPPIHEDILEDYTPEDDISEEDISEEDWQETLRRYLEQQQAQAREYVPVKTEVEPVKEMVVEEAPRVIPQKKRKPILIEEEKKAREKIDVKKLIVYSEIMKPKYTE